jgi:hypothetical protein
MTSKHKTESTGKMLEDITKLSAEMPRDNPYAYMLVLATRLGEFYDDAYLIGYSNAQADIIINKSTEDE